MSELRDLYQEVIIDHSKRPRNFHKIANTSHKGEGYNPLCGDKVNVYLEIKDGKIINAAFEGSGCAISTASASMMTDIMKTKSIVEIEALFKKFQNLVTGLGNSSEGPDLDKLEIFEGVSEFPARVKCAILPWHTAMLALKQENTVAKTE
ncbi:MAG: SUF system NifU family Fe-S cluster assembly protein [Oligoflexia bacterium]|nr:SUF system NifU family Fe-S cluster assembly protein [Oligoflexia bacterium]